MVYSIGSLKRLVNYNTHKEEMQYIEVVLSIMTIIAGGGWFVTYKAYKRKASGEATQAEAEGWQKQQETYHNTIEELKNTCEYIKNDRDQLRKENEELRRENQELRRKLAGMEDQIQDLRRDIARQGRRIEALTNKKKHGTKTEKDSTEG